MWRQSCIHGYESPDSVYTFPPPQAQIYRFCNLIRNEFIVFMPTFHADSLRQRRSLMNCLILSYKFWLSISSVDRLQIIQAMLEQPNPFRFLEVGLISLVGNFTLQTGLILLSADHTHPQRFVSFMADISTVTSFTCQMTLTRFELIFQP